MSDTDSDASGGSQQLNEVVQPIESSPLVKPAVSPSTTTFNHKGIQYRSIGVLCTPELAAQAAKEAEAKVIKVDRFASLPDNVFSRIIGWTITIELDKHEKAVQEADWTDIGRISNSKFHFLVRRRTARHSVFRRLSLLNRRSYHLIRPEFWRKLDLSSFDSDTYISTGLTSLNRLLPTKPTVSLPTPPSKAPAGSTASQEANPNTSRTSTSSTSPPPRKKKKVVPKVVPQENQGLPSFGQLVETIVIGSYYSCISNFFDAYQINLPNLQHVFFPPKTNIALQHFQKFALNATYTLRTVDHLFFANNGEDNDCRVEAILSLFNAAPNLERFGVSGKLCLDELRGKRLAFVWRLNSRLKHSPTGCLGVGLKELYFGNGVEMTVGFLRSLKESCPRLTKLHIAVGVKVTIDATPQGGTPFDLAAFATHWSTLTSLSLLGTDTFSASGNLDAILKVCPSITHLHIRSDHISYNFFTTIVNELASFPLPPTGPPAKLATRQIGSENPASAALVEASKLLRKEETGLKHPLKHLGITCRLGETGEAKQFRLEISGSCILSISLLLLSFQARGLDYPNEMGGQRDLLNRAALMTNLERKKQREQATREKEEVEKKKKAELEKQNANGKGKGKEVETSLEVVGTLDGGEVEVTQDIEITSEA